MNKKPSVIMLIIMLCMACAFTSIAEGTSTPGYRAGLTEDDYIGTWHLKSMMIEGYTVPAESLNMHATIVVTNGQIEITDVFGEKKSYATVFDNGLLSFVNEAGEQMIVYITEEGQLHVEQEAGLFIGTAQDEGSPLEKGGNINMANLTNSLVSHYYERAE